jgi:hypothetical protein
VTPTESGYQVSPHVPFSNFSVRFPTIGVVGSARALGGYIRPLASGRLVLQVAVPGGATGVVCQVDGSAVRARVSSGWATFSVMGQSHRSVGWSVSWH